MEQMIEHISQAFNLMVAAIDWVYIAFFMITAYTVTRMLGDTNVMKSVSVKLKKRWMVLITAVILAAVFGTAYYFSGGFSWFDPTIVNYGFALFFSFILALFLNEYVGFEYILDKIFKVQLNKKNYKKNIEG
jgi:hypothetical protein